LTIDRRHFVQLVAAAAIAPPTVVNSTVQRTIALLFDSLVSPFWVAASERLRRGIEARGWTVLEAVSNMDDARQFTQVQSMIQRGVDGIVIVHTDDKAVIPAIRAANAAGVPMVHFNRAPAASDAYSVAVVADNRKLMDETVTALLSIAGKGPKRHKTAILLGDLGDANGAHRRDGFNDAIARDPQRLEVVAQIATEWNADKAFAGLSSALRAHPDIDLLVTSSDFLAPQIEQALRIADKWYPSGDPRHVLIAGFDGDDNGYRQLADGFYDVDGVQDLDREVSLTLGALGRMWLGERPPKILIDPGFVITRDHLVEERERMWGYGVFRANGAAVASPDGSALSGAGGIPRSSSVGSALRWTAALAAAGGFTHALFSTRTVVDTLVAILPLAILTGGQLLVLLIGQIDLSMTGVLALASVVSASLMTRQGGLGATALGVAAPLILGAVVGIFNGLCTAVLRVPSFIVTLAVTTAGSGTAVWYASSVSDTLNIGGLPAAFLRLGYGAVAGIPIAPLLCAATLGLLHYVLSRTVVGAWMYAIGHNAQAARICGVPVAAVTVVAFAASGLCAGLASLIYTSRLETGSPTLGHDMLLDVVGAAVIGGVSLFGGRGSVWMVLVGVAFLAFLDKSLQLLGISLFMVLAMKGCAILAAAILDARRVQRARQAS
jgi:ribose/xylose/arabinose/galactoside ABC-type transport system permease subunit/ABC-type sugar transport system substrate-binding protein